MTLPAVALLAVIAGLVILGVAYQALTAIAHRHHIRASIRHLEHYANNPANRQPREEEL